MADWCLCSKELCVSDLYAEIAHITAPGGEATTLRSAVKLYGQLDTVQNGRRELDTEQYILWLLCGLDIAYAIQNWQLEKCQTALWGIEVEHGETVHTESPRVTTHHADYEPKPTLSTACVMRESAD